MDRGNRWQGPGGGPNPVANPRAGAALKKCAACAYCGHGSFFGSRSFADRAGRHGGGCVSTFARTRAACGAARLPAILAGGASQHAGHRERGDGGGHRPRGGGNLDDPRRLGRRDAAESRAARDRGAVRHAGVVVSRADRSRAGSRARHGSGDGAGATARPYGQRGYVSAGRGGTAGVFPAGGGGSDGASRAGRGTRGAGVAARIEFVQRAGGGGARAAVRVRVALRA